MNPNDLMNPLGWTPPEGLTPEQWQEAGSLLGRMQNTQWRIGDWWNNGVAWGKGRDACASAGIDYGTAQNCGRVARAIQFSRRRENLSFMHHMEVCSLADPAEQDALLDWCLTANDGKLASARALRERVRSHRAEAPASLSDFLEPAAPRTPPPSRPFTFASLCSGIEGASVAWGELGWVPAWFAEVDPFCSRLLAARHPGVPNLGDMNKIDPASVPTEPACPSTSSSAARRARVSPSPDFDRAWMTLAGGSPSAMSDWHLLSLLAGSSGRTSPVSCRREEDGRLVPSSGGWLNAGMASPTGCWTLSTSEYPRDAVGSSLSDIVEEAGWDRGPCFLTARNLDNMSVRLARNGKSPPARLARVFGASTATRPPSSPTTSCPPSGPGRAASGTDSSTPSEPSTGAPDD